LDLISNFLLVRQRPNDMAQQQQKQRQQQQQQQQGIRRARGVAVMAARDGQRSQKKGGGLGSFLRRAMGGALAAAGLAAAPLPRETLDLLRESPAETLQLLVRAWYWLVGWSLGTEGSTDGLPILTHPLTTNSSILSFRRRPRTCRSSWPGPGR
jgi:hypothetical protein